MSQYSKRFLFRCKEGKVVIDDQERYDKVLKSFEGKDGFLVLEKIYKQRSIQENRYLFGVIIPILINETEIFGGWDKESVYRWFEGHFLNNFPTKKPREWITIKELSTKDFEELMERIRQWASIELGIYIPLPIEVEEFGEVVL